MGTLSAALEKTKEVKKTRPELQVDKDKIVPIHYSKLHRAPYQYNHFKKNPEQYEQEVRTLKDEIKAVGKVLQPVLVRKKDVDDYEIIAGQHRRDASELLVIEDGENKYEFVPSIITKMTDAQAEFAGFGTNTTWEKDDSDIMHEIIRKKYLLENFPEDFPNIPDKGRMIEKLAIAMKLSKSTVGEYLQIATNLSDKAMDAFEQKQLNKSAAVEMAKLPHEEQDTLLDEGVIKQKDIKAYKEEKTERTVHRTTVTDTVKTTSLHKVEDDSSSSGNTTPEIIDVLPGQYRVTNTDMDIEETITPIVEDVSKGDAENETTIIQADSYGKCICPHCKLPSRIEDTFKFYNKGYCMNCLYDLIMDLADTGVITLDMSDMGKNGIIIRS